MSRNGIAVLRLVRRSLLILRGWEPRFAHRNHGVRNMRGNLDDVARSHGLAWAGDEALQDQHVHFRGNEARHRLYALRPVATPNDPG